MLVDLSMMELQDAVDGLQADAERIGLVDAVGQDALQAVMAGAFSTRSS